MAGLQKHMKAGIIMILILIAALIVLNLLHMPISSFWTIFLGIIVLAGGFQSVQHNLLIRAIPTSKIGSVALGIVEVCGKMNADKPIITPYSKTECLCYMCEEHVGKNTAQCGENLNPFIIKDDTGEACVDPKKAEIHWNHQKIVVVQGSGPEAKCIVLDPKNQNTGFTPGTHIYTEYYFEAGDYIYVMGTAKSPEGKSSILISQGTNNPTFIISNKSEKKLVNYYKNGYLFYLVLGGGLIAIGILTMLHYFKLI